MNVHNHNGVPYRTFPHLSHPFLVHGIFSRKGGVSTPPYKSLNTSFHVGDNPCSVLENRSRICKTLDTTCIISSKQTHGDTIRAITTPHDEDVELDGYDALITTQPGIALMIQQADCQAVLLFDPERLAVGIVHAGWRGSVLNILGKTVKAMNQNFNSDPSRILAAISPSLGPCCAEFVNFRHELPQSFHSFQGHPCHFDFWAISRSQLEEAGLLSGNIVHAEVCTRCNDEYFSYRREKLTGRFSSLIGIRENPLR